jgi:hypothetical protein
MKRLAGIAATVASALALSGCLGGGPSDADVSKVQEALASLGPEWTVGFVDNASSESEGIQRYLAIGLNHDKHIAPEDLVDVFAVMVETLPASYRYEIKFLFVVGPDEAFPDLRPQANDLGLNPGYETFYKDGDIWTTVEEMKRIVDEHQT